MTYEFYKTRKYQLTIRAINLYGSWQSEEDKNTERAERLYRLFVWASNQLNDLEENPK